MSCICGLEKDYSECCGEIIDSKREALTPEELMRSRYSAYVQGDGNYLVKSATSSYKDEDIKEIEDFSKSVEWLKLDVLFTEGDVVEFKAYYKDKNGLNILHEKSKFIQENNIWKYKDGELYNTKIQRNEPCPCGSGKKFKKCCFKS